MPSSFLILVFIATGFVIVASFAFTGLGKWAVGPRRSGSKRARFPLAGVTQLRDQQMLAETMELEIQKAKEGERMARIDAAHRMLYMHAQRVELARGLLAVTPYEAPAHV